MKNVMRSIVVIGWVGVGSGGMCCLYTRHILDIQKLLHFKIQYKMGEGGGQQRREKQQQTTPVYVCRRLAYTRRMEQDPESNI